MKCARCKEPEDRIDGYCSLYCRDMDEVEVERNEAQSEVKRLENLRAFDTGTTPLPKGLMLEHTRLDAMWQQLVRERDALKNAIKDHAEATYTLETVQAPDWEQYVDSLEVPLYRAAGLLPRPQSQEDTTP